MNYGDYKHQKYVRQPQEVGLSPIHCQTENSYTVMVSWINGNGEMQWNPIHNTWGWAYTQLGHAIRRAQSYKHRSNQNRVCVIRTHTGEVVWADWEVEGSESYIGKGERI